MKKSILLFLILGFGALCFGQSNTGPQQIKPVEIRNTSDLPEIIKGEVDASIDTDILIEMLESGLVYSKVGELHTTILENPQVLGLEIRKDQQIEDLFIEYITTDDASARKAAEDQLIDLY